MSALLHPPPAPAAIVIYDDGGGYVNDYKNVVMKYAAQNRQIKIKGSCRSACTLALSYTNACVYRTAVLQWHFAYFKYTGETDMATTEEMISWAPWNIQQQLRDNIRKDYSPGATLTGDELIAKGVRECKP